MSIVLQRAVYTLISGASFEAWMAENEEDLRAWYTACCIASGDQPSLWEPNGPELSDFLEFCHCQHDAQLLQEEEQPLSEAEEACARDDDTPYEDQP